jgi:hypothetical protein
MSRANKGSRGNTRKKKQLGINYTREGIGRQPVGQVEGEQ